MAKIIEKKGFLGDKQIIYLEQEKEGEFSYIDGEWIWIQQEY